MKLKAACILMLMALSLTSCDSLPAWLGGSDDSDKPKVEGKRIDVLSDSSTIKPDESLADINVTVPGLKVNENWREAGGSPQGMEGNLQITGFKHQNRVHIGDGDTWDEPLYSQPVVAGDTAFAMDAKGYITAHDAADIDKIKWKSKAVVAKHKPDILGGGLAFDSGRLYVTTGRGRVFALDAATGKQIWQQSMGVPLRAAPKVLDGKVYVISVDNQLFALDAEKGTQLWGHRGINENAGYLSSISAAVSGSIVLAPYSSGQVHALDTATGQEIWSDSLLKPRRNSATFGFSGIGGNPIIRDDIVYIAGSSGFTAAFSLQNGRRLWEQDISSLNTPWLAGDFVYIISTDSQLACLYAADGRVKWVKQLQRYENEKKRKNPYFWFGPVMANGELLVANAVGEMLEIAPKDGSVISKIDIPEDITYPPVIAGGRVYLLTTDARLHIIY